MKSQDNNNQKKQLRELSDEELKNVTGGAINVTGGAIIELKRTCGIQFCPPGYKLDRSLEPCQCVQD